MVDETDKANHLVRNLPATANGMSALRPIALFVVSMLRMWADSIERLEANYDKKLEDTAATLEEAPDKERAA